MFKLYYQRKRNISTKYLRRETVQTNIQGWSLHYTCRYPQRTNLYENYYYIIL